MERGGADHVISNGDNEKDSKHALIEKGRGIIAMVLGEKEKSDAEDWKEFKKGFFCKMFLFFGNHLLIFYIRDIYLSYII